MQLPKNETMRLIEGVQRLAHTPTIKEGETSGTGKTVKVESRDRTYRLDTEKLLEGDTVFRDGLKFKLYTPERMKGVCRSNYQPGPVAGANDVPDTSDLPEPTHTPRS